VGHLPRRRREGEGDEAIRRRPGPPGRRLQRQREGHGARRRRDGVRGEGERPHDRLRRRQDGAGGLQLPPLQDLRGPLQHRGPGDRPTHGGGIQVRGSGRHREQEGGPEYAGGDLLPPGAHRHHGAIHDLQNLEG